MPDQFDAELMSIQHCRDKNENNRKKNSKLKSAEVASLYTLRWTGVIKHRRFKIV